MANQHNDVAFVLQKHVIVLHHLMSYASTKLDGIKGTKRWYFFSSWLLERTEALDLPRKYSYFSAKINK